MPAITVMLSVRIIIAWENTKTHCATNINALQGPCHDQRQRNALAALGTDHQEDIPALTDRNKGSMNALVAQPVSCHTFSVIICGDAISMDMTGGI
jgi:hypothetical protein